MKWMGFKWIDIDIELATRDGIFHLHRKEQRLLTQRIFCHQWKQMLEWTKEHLSFPGQKEYFFWVSQVHWTDVNIPLSTVRHRKTCAKCLICTTYFNYILIEFTNSHFMFQHTGIPLFVCKADFLHVFEVCPFNTDTMVTAHYHVIDD